MDADARGARDVRAPARDVPRPQDGADKIIPLRDARAPERALPRELPRSSRQAAAAQPVPPPPPPSKRAKAGSRMANSPIVVFFSGVFVLIVLVVLGVGAAFVAGRQALTAKGPLGAEKIVNILPGADIGRDLEREGVISSAFTFTAASRLLGASRSLKAGEYRFRPEVSMADVMLQLMDGKVILHPITIPEGWTSEQVVQRLRDSPVLTGNIARTPEEGSLLPDTYSIARGTTREAVLQLMQQTQQRVLRDLWAKRPTDIPVANPRELVILASIVEKETGRADERARVAGVFVNRLKRGMRLESDPTILYGLYGGLAWLQARTILRSELNADNPYNTYKRPGLPPGPIANPGRAAMEAVIAPAKTNDIFFVADGTGGHVFAETLDEHNRNVQRWRQIEAERRQRAGEPPLEVLGQPTTSPASPARQPPARRTTP